MQYFSIDFEPYNYLQFPTHLSGNENGHFDPNTGRFTAPVSGRYSFGLSLRVWGSSGGEYNYRIYMQRGGSLIHTMIYSGTMSGSYKLDGRYFTTEVVLNRGQYVQFYIPGYFSSGLRYGGSQSYFEGKLIKAN